MKSKIDIDWDKAREYCYKILPKLKSEQDYLFNFELIEPRLSIETFLSNFCPTIILKFSPKGGYLTVMKNVSVFREEFYELKSRLEDINRIVNEIAKKNNLKTNQLLYNTYNGEILFREWTYQPNYRKFLIKSK